MPNSQNSDTAVESTSQIVGDKGQTIKSTQVASDNSEGNFVVSKETYKSNSPATAEPRSTVYKIQTGDLTVQTFITPGGASRGLPEHLTSIYTGQGDLSNSVHGDAKLDDRIKGAVEAAFKDGIISQQERSSLSKLAVEVATEHAPHAPVYRGDSPAPAPSKSR